MDNQLIFETQFGSHLYGTNTPNSDKDLKRVYIPEPRRIILPVGTGTSNVSTKANERAKNSADDVDIESFALRRFVDLLLEGQTVALDILFATPLIRDGSIEGQIGLDWINLWYARRHFFSRKPAAFLGYCKQQANKYGIKGSHVAAARRAVEILETLEASHPGGKLYDFPLSMGEMAFGEEFINILRPDTALNDGVQYLEVNNRKVPLTATVDYALGVFRKMLKGYGERALLAEKNEGVDWKALSHAVRIGEQAIEFLQTENIVFPRANAEELKAIKTGKLEYKVVAERIENLLEQVEAASLVSKLPEEPDRQYAEDHVYRQYVERVRRYG